MTERICSIEGCDKLKRQRGWCHNHYMRWRRHGDPLANVRTRNPAPKDGLCTIDDCDRPHFARGWCNVHWLRWRKYGDLSYEYWADPEIIADRFWRQVDVGLCWTWTGRGNGRGYGTFSANGVLVYAHRWAWATLVGPIGEGLEVDHLCRNRACVNPDHMDLVTRAENNRRAIAARTW